MRMTDLPLTTNVTAQDFIEIHQNGERKRIKLSSLSSLQEIKNLDLVNNGVVSKITYDVNFTGTDTATAFSNWLDGCRSLASQKTTSSTRHTSVKVELPKMSAITLGSQVTVNGTRLCLDFQQASIYFPSTSGFIVSGTGYDSAPYYSTYRQGLQPVIQNAWIVGPGKATVTKGITITGNTDTQTPATQMTPANQSIRDVIIESFGKGVTFEKYTYLNQLERVRIRQCDYGLFLEQSMTGGERFSYANGNIAQCGVAVDFSTTADATSGADIFINNASLDHNTQQMKCGYKNRIWAEQLHIEHTHYSQIPFVTSGNSGNGISLSNSHVLATENASTADALLSCSGGSYFEGRNLYLHARRGVNTARNLAAGTTGRVIMVGTKLPESFSEGAMHIGGSVDNYQHWDDGTHSLYNAYTTNSTTQATRLTESNFEAVANGGWYEMRKTGAAQKTLRWVIPINTRERGAISFGFTHEGVGFSVGEANIQVVMQFIHSRFNPTRGVNGWDRTPKLLSDVTQAVPNVETIGFFNTPGWSADAYAPAWANAVVVDLVLPASFPDYVSGTKVYRIKNIRLSQW